MTNGQTMHALREIPLSDDAMDPRGRRRRSTSEGGSVRTGFSVRELLVSAYMPICDGAGIRPIRRRILRRSSSFGCWKDGISIALTRKRAGSESFLLTSLKFFVADEEDRNRAQKRGGGALLPLEFWSGEERYQLEPAHDETPERIYERRWALSVLDRVLEKLRNEFMHHGRAEHFERLKLFLLEQSDTSYAALASEMNTSEGALKVAIHRLRKRYRELFRQEIADTVADPAEVESELRHLAAVLTRN